MKLSEALDIFAVRLLEWSQRDFLRELESECRLLSLISLHERVAGGLVLWNKSLSHDERTKVVETMTLRAHENARRIKGLPITEEVKERADFYLGQIKIHMNRLPPLTSADRRLPTFRPVDPDRCLKHLVNSVSPILGKVSRRRSEVRCTHKYEDWKLVTEFTFRRKWDDLQFEYWATGLAAGLDIT